jgi:hypothetical protein
MKSGWLTGAYACGLTTFSAKAIFVDTDLLPAVESRVGDLVQNDVEGRLVYQVSWASDNGKDELIFSLRPRWCAAGSENTTSELFRLTDSKLSF